MASQRCQEKGRHVVDVSYHFAGLYKAQRAKRLGIVETFLTNNAGDIIMLPFESWRLGGVLLHRINFRYCTELNLDPHLPAAICS